MGRTRESMTMVTPSHETFCYSVKSGDCWVEAHMPVPTTLHPSRGQQHFYKTALEKVLDYKASLASDGELGPFGYVLFDEAGQSIGYGALRGCETTDAVARLICKLFDEGYSVHFMKTAAMHKLITEAVLHGRLAGLPRSQDRRGQKRKKKPSHASVRPPKAPEADSSALVR